MYDGRLLLLLPFFLEKGHAGNFSAEQGGYTEDPPRVKVLGDLLPNVDSIELKLEAGIEGIKDAKRCL